MMISVYSKKENTLLEETRPDSLHEEDIKKLKESWIHLFEPTMNEIKEVLEITKISSVMFQNALDKDESAHIEIDGELTHIVLDVPYNKINSNKQNEYSTTPFSIMYNNDFFVTVCFEDNSIVEKFLLFRNKEFTTTNSTRTAAQIIFKTSVDFVQNSKLISKDIDILEEKLSLNLKNSEMLEMLQMAKSLVYLLTAINSNRAVLTKMKKVDDFSKTKNDFDLIEDAEIELRQAKEVVGIYREILNNRINSYSIIINNNVNDVMKVLTLITISLSIPTIVASFYGMNFINLPFSDSKFAFVGVIIVSVLLIVIANILLIKYTNKSNKRKKEKTYARK